MTPTRRTVLLAGLAGLALAGSGAAALGLRSTVLGPIPNGLLVFDAEQYSIVAAIADTLHPGADDLPTGTEAGVPQALDAIAAIMHPDDRDELLQALRLIENALVGALLDQRPTTFTGSTPQVRTRTLRAWQSSRVTVRRQAFKALKGLCAGAYWSQPGNGAITGYHGPIDYGQASASKPTTFTAASDEVPR